MIRSTDRNVFIPGLLLAVAALFIPLSAPAAEGSDADSDSICSQKAYAKALRYQQQSAEIDALQRQSFALARQKLEDKIEGHDADDNLAIVTDLDETAIDNTPLLVRDMRACHDFTQWDTWSHWEQKGHPEWMPGAKSFFNYADAQGVAIFYITNRFKENKQDTIDTLNDLGFPQVSSDSVMVYGDPKTERRAKVSKDHTIVMLLGDSLADFSGIFDDASLSEQHAGVKDNADKFGDKWIVLPNATYGDWTDADLDGWDAPMQAD